MKFSKRLEGLDESATFRYSKLAKDKKTLNLTIGRTNFDTPKPIKEAAKKALDEGQVNYTPSLGIPELRSAIAKKLSEENGIDGISSDSVIVSAGAKQVLYEALMALVGDGDVVAVPDPSWVSYGPMVGLAGGKPAWLPLKPEKGFKPDEDFFSALEDAKPKVIMLNSPSNPTGAVYEEKTIKKIVDVAERNRSVIISDEIYEKLIYEGRHFSAASVYEDTITVNGFSKEFSMTGWRLGYAASAKKEYIEKMDLIQGQTVSCATSFVQYGAVAAFTPEVRAEVSEMVSELRKRRDVAVKKLAKFSVLEKPAGAFYLFPFFSGADDLELADRLMDAGVGVIPGSPFGSKGRGCLRISYGGVSAEELAKAVEIIEETV